MKIKTDTNSINKLFSQMNQLHVGFKNDKTSRIGKLHNQMNQLHKGFEDDKTSRMGKLHNQMNQLHSGVQTQNLQIEYKIKERKVAPMLHTEIIDVEVIKNYKIQKEVTIKSSINWALVANTTMLLTTVTLLIASMN